MIIVTVQLHSAITGEKQELARMTICNEGDGTPEHGNYIAATFVGRSSADLDRRRVSHMGRVKNYPRKAKHVWNLVARCLQEMSYS